MPRLNDARHEAFAQARARGMSRAAAQDAADLEPANAGAAHVDRRADVRARIAELRVTRDALRQADLEETVLGLLDLATRGDHASAAARREARAARLEAHRLAERLARRGEQTAPETLPPPMSHAEWMATYGVLAHPAP